VSGWPGLLIDGYADKKGEKRLRPVRIDRLASGVLLCIFEGEVARVDIHQKPETLHFGFSADGPGNFEKKLRDLKGAELPNTKVSVDWRSAPDRILNVTAFAESMRKKLSEKLSEQLAPLTSAQFGLEMVEGVEKVIFLAKP
jgi:hypothetical protein